MRASGWLVGFLEVIAWNIDWLAIVAGTRATINPSVLESVSEEKDGRLLQTSQLAAAGREGDSMGRDARRSDDVGVAYPANGYVNVHFSTFAASI